MSRSLAIIATTLFVLSACSKPSATLKYNIALRAKDKAQAQELLKATERVMNRRMAAIQVTGAAIVLPAGDAAGTLEVRLPTKDAQDRIAGMVESPYTLTFKLQTKEVPGKPAEAEWAETGLNGSHVLWAQAIGNTATKVISVEIQLNPEGEQLIKKVFKENKDKNLGIFVYDTLISAIKMSGDVTSRILLSGVPSEELALVVADDMNVGLHVQFTPAD